MVQRRESIPAAGALLSAMVASACCWLPLLLIVLGFSGAGIGAVFESLRPWLIGLSVVLLGVGFYVTYSRREDCEEGSDCERRNARARRAASIMLWMATMGVVVFTFLPGHIGALTRLGQARPSASPIVITLQIEGMSCEGCAAGVQQALEKLDGVGSADVSYEEKRALVSLQQPDSVRVSDLVTAVAEAGYTALPREPQSAGNSID